MYKKRFESQAQLKSLRVFPGKRVKKSLIKDIPVRKCLILIIGPLFNDNGFSVYIVCCSRKKIYCKQDFFFVLNHITGLIKKKIMRFVIRI